MSHRADPALGAANHSILAKGAMFYYMAVKKDGFENPGAYISL